MADSQVSQKAQTYASKIVAKFGTNGKVSSSQMTQFFGQWKAAQDKLPGTTAEEQAEPAYTEAQTTEIMSYFDNNQDKVLDQQELSGFVETMLGLGSNDTTALDNALAN